MKNDGIAFVHIRDISYAQQLPSESELNRSEREEAKEKKRKKNEKSLRVYKPRYITPARNFAIAVLLK